MSEEWSIGKAVTLKLEDILDEFIEHPSYREIQKKYRISGKNVYRIFNISSNDPVLWWHRGSTISHIKAPKWLQNKLEDAGWKHGKKD